MKRRILAALLSLVMLVSLSACGAQAKEPSIKELANYKDLSGILEEVVKENKEGYFSQLMKEAGIYLVEVTDRDVVKDGDIVATDYTGYVDGVAFVGGSTIVNGTSNPQFVDVSNNCGINNITGQVTASYINGFTSGLVGAQKNVDKSGKVTFPEGYGSTTLVDDDEDDTNNKSVTLDNKEVTFVFNVKAIYTVRTSENITDETVAKYFSESYGVSTVDELMKYIEEDTENQVFESYFNNVVYNAGASIIQVKDRDTVQAGDILKVDYTGYHNGVAFSKGTATDQWIDVDNNCSINTSTGAVGTTFDKGFTDPLKTAKVGAEVSADLTLSDTYGETTYIDDDKDSSNDVKVNLSGATVTFKYKVKEIYIEVTMDTITDAIVKEYFGESYKVETVEDFIKELKKELIYNYVINYAIENSKYDISEAYITQRVDEYEAFFKAVYCPDYDLDTFFKYYGSTLENERAQWTVSMESQIQAELIFAAIAEGENLDLDEEAFDKYVDSVIEVAKGESGNTFFAKEENVWKLQGCGNAKIGKAFWLNQTAVREYLMDLGSETLAE